MAGARRSRAMAAVPLSLLLTATAMAGCAKERGIVIAPIVIDRDASMAAAAERVAITRDAVPDTVVEGAEPADEGSAEGEETAKGEEDAVAPAFDPADVRPDTLPDIIPAIYEPPIALPSAEATWLGYGLQLLARNEPRLAQRALERSIALEGPLLGNLTGAGIAALLRGHLTAAENYLTAARRIDDEHVAATTALGLVYLARNELEPARRLFRIAFVASSGASDLAAEKLVEVDRRIASARAVDAREAERRAAVTFRTVRTGRSEFRLEPIDPRSVGAGPGDPGPTPPAIAAAATASGRLPPDPADRQTGFPPRPAPAARTPAAPAPAGPKPAAPATATPAAAATGAAAENGAGPAASADHFIP